MATKDTIYAAVAGAAGGVVGTKVSEVFVKTVPDLGERTVYSVVGLFSLAVILVLYGIPKSIILYNQLRSEFSKKERKIDNIRQ